MHEKNANKKLTKTLLVYLIYACTFASQYRTLKKLVLLSFCLYFVILMLAATHLIADQFGKTSNEPTQHFADNCQHNISASSLSFLFEEEENDFDLFLSHTNFPVIQKLIFLFKSENPKHTCFAFYLKKSIMPFHQDIYILDEVFRI